MASSHENAKTDTIPPPITQRRVRGRSCVRGGLGVCGGGANGVCDEEWCGAEGGGGRGEGGRELKANLGVV